MRRPDARAVLSERRAYLDNVNTIAAYARDMKDFLQESDLTEGRAFIESFVKEIMVIPGDALIRYTVPMPDDSFLARRVTDNMALDDSVLSTVQVGTPDLTVGRTFAWVAALWAGPCQFRRDYTSTGIRPVLGLSPRVRGNLVLKRRGRRDRRAEGRRGTVPDLAGRKRQEEWGSIPACGDL